MRSGNGWVTCEQGHQHWGLFGAAGVLVYAPDPRDQGQALVLLQHRARWSHQGGTWALPGGAMDSDESPAEAALREADEECMLDPKLVVPRGMYTEEHGGWAYHTIVAQAREPFRVYSDAYESDETLWLPAGQVARRDLHPGFAASWPVLRRALVPLTVIVDGAGFGDGTGTAAATHTGIVSCGGSGSGGDRHAGPGAGTGARVGAGTGGAGAGGPRTATGPGAAAGTRTAPGGAVGPGGAAALRAYLTGLTRAGIGTLPDGLAAPVLERWYPDYVLVLDAAAAAEAAETDPVTAAEAGPPGGSARFSWNQPLVVRTADVRVVAAADWARAGDTVAELAGGTPGRRLVLSARPGVRDRAAAAGAVAAGLDRLPGLAGPE